MQTKEKIKGFDKRDIELQNWLAGVCSEMYEDAHQNQIVYDVISKMLWAELFRCRRKRYKDLKNIKAFSALKNWAFSVIMERKNEILDTVNFCRKYPHVFNLDKVYLDV